MKPDNILGISPSAFKTFLKRKRHKIRREFFSIGCVSEYRGRFYRWRWWSNPQTVDISCRKADFDRWANSTEESVSLVDAINALAKGDE